MALTNWVNHMVVTARLSGGIVESVGDFVARSLVLRAV